MNYMKEVANLLGVELEEEFRTNEFDDYTFKLTEDGLRWKCDDSWKWQGGFFTLEDILCNRVEIVKKSNDPILTAEEKEYLSYIIRPFRDRVKYVRKHTHIDNKHEWIEIIFTNIFMCFPFFEKGTMYKGMKAGKDYTLEDLGL